MRALAVVFALIFLSLTTALAQPAKESANAEANRAPNESGTKETAAKDPVAKEAAPKESKEDPVASKEVSPAKDIATGKARPCAAATRLSPLLLFAEIEKAWKQSIADSIIAFLPEERIVLQLEKAAPAGALYSRDQAAYMLKDAMRYTATESFEFVDFQYSRGGEEPPSAQAEWTFRREPAGGTIVQKVHIKLWGEPGCWVVSEIRIEE